MVEIETKPAPPELDQPPLIQAIGFFTSFQKRILIILSVFFILFLAAGGLFFYWWLTAFQKNQVDLKIIGSSQTASGEAQVYTVSFWNNTNQILTDAILVLHLPAGSILGAQNQNPRLIEQSVGIERKELGDIGIGGGSRVDFTITLIGADRSVQSLRADLSYRPQNTTSRFENSASLDVALGGAALSLDLKSPSAVFQGSRIKFEIIYENNSDQTFDNVRIQIIYPSDFVFVSAQPSPPSFRDNSSWNLGTLGPQAKGKINFEGVYRGLSPQAKFSAAIGISLADKFVRFNDLSNFVDFGQVPLVLSISLNDVLNYLAQPSDYLNYKIRYKNNSDAVLSDLVLKVNLEGLMYDFSTLNTRGFFSSLDNTITWNVSNTPSLGKLVVGEEEEVNFQIRLKPQYIIRTFRDKNFTLTARAALETKTVPSSITAPSLVAQADITSKVKTRVDFRSFGIFKDSAILNSGPIPPKVNRNTTYAVHWALKNYSNDLSNVVVRSSLGQGVAWTGKVFGANTEGLDYNERTGVLIWSAGSLPAASGILTETKEVIFQVALTPAVNQVGSNVALVGEASFSGHDDFTDEDLSMVAGSVSSDLQNEFGMNSQAGRVTP